MLAFMRASCKFTRRQCVLCGERQALESTTFVDLDLEELSVIRLWKLHFACFSTAEFIRAHLLQTPSLHLLPTPYLSFRNHDRLFQPSCADSLSSGKGSHSAPNSQSRKIRKTFIYAWVSPPRPLGRRHRKADAGLDPIHQFPLTASQSSHCRISMCIIFSFSTRLAACSELTVYMQISATGMHSGIIPLRYKT